MTGCPICGSERGSGLAPWILRCPGCGFEQSSLPSRIDEARSHEVLDEASRSAGLSRVRDDNFAVILATLDRLRPSRGAILEVGCGHGWFLGAAAEHGWKAIGIEPDRAIAAEAIARGLPVRIGTWPDAIEPGERFDAIVFNDVFEHLPDVQAAMSAGAACLAPNGLLVVNLPDARGVLYRAARLLARVGVSGPLQRLWQKDFPSPHVSYFTAPLLRRLAGQHGFAPVHGARLQSVSLRGLWPRIRYDRRTGVLEAAIAFASVCCVYPLLRLLPPDIWFDVFEKAPAPAASRAPRGEARDRPRPDANP